ncbi:MAG: hypothetical protein U1C33_03175, partial [Candidatus Cloacimonadaceae bacterium]|nr:hypothetical protein [Candidatus Cloacimonadaceae bacterium]
MNLRRIKNHLGIGVLASCLVITAFFLIVFLIRIFYMGISVVNWEFLSTPPRDAMTAGGIYPALVGTFWLTVLSIAIALPLGVLTAVYLTSYGKPYWLVRIVKVAINTLAGIPSIIYGLFGMAI